MTRDNRDDAKTIHESKEMFVAAINQGMDALMNDCGYSRERAAMVLLRELQRSGADCKKKPTVSSFRPTDDEMFQAMKNYGLGTEEATRALIVRNAFHKAMETFDQKNGSDAAVDADIAVRAISNLISRISPNNVLYESDSSLDINSEAEDEKLSIHPHLRINPVSSVSTSNKPQRNAEQKRKRASQHVSKTSRRKGIPSDESFSGSNTPSLSPPSTSGRKRKIDDASLQSRDENKRRETNNDAGDATRKAPTNFHETPSSRSRSDSVSSVVDAKLSASLPTSTRPKRQTRSGSPGVPKSSGAETEMSTSSETNRLGVASSTTNETRGTSA